jgi:hypothetical protein
MVECQLSGLDVIGSNPVARSSEDNIIEQCQIKFATF